MICAECRRTRRIKARGLCDTCYDREWRGGGRRDANPEVLRAHITEKRAATPGGLSGLALEMSARFGTTASSERRQLERILSGRGIYTTTADRLTTFFDLDKLSVT